MALHFDRAEFESRIVAARKALAANGLDALLLFAQESLYYLTGFDTSGFVFFQCAVLTRDEGPITLLTRRPDLEQARRTSIIEDIRLWYDQEGSDPSRELFEILAEKGLKGARIGIELRTFGLTADKYELVRQRLAGWCELVDASHIVRTLRLVKSPAEIACVRRAAELADQSLEAMLATARPGAFEGDIAAAGAVPILAGGGDPPPSGPVLGSGDRALLIRSATGFRHLDPVDQLTLEFAGVYRQYHACLMRTLLVGEASPRHRELFDAAQEALLACEARLAPGRTMAEVYTAHADAFDRRGLREHRLNACGYSLGAVYAPSWMDWPMFYQGNPVVIEPGMVFFLHMILMDSETGTAMTLGRTSVVGERGPEVLSRAPVELVVR
jgi:Xaa-Pro dipeptidase